MVADRNLLVPGKTLLGSTWNKKCSTWNQKAFSYGAPFYFSKSVLFYFTHCYFGLMHNGEIQSSPTLATTAQEVPDQIPYEQIILMCTNQFRTTQVLYEDT